MSRCSWQVDKPGNVFRVKTFILVFPNNNMKSCRRASAVVFFFFSGSNLAAAFTYRVSIVAHGVPQGSHATMHFLGPDGNRACWTGGSGSRRGDHVMLTFPHTCNRLVVLQVPMLHVRPPKAPSCPAARQDHMCIVHVDQYAGLWGNVPRARCPVASGKWQVPMPSVAHAPAVCYSSLVHHVNCTTSEPDTLITPPPLSSLRIPVSLLCEYHLFAHPSLRLPGP